MVLVFYLSDCHSRSFEMDLPEYRKIFWPNNATPYKSGENECPQSPLKRKKERERERERHQRKNNPKEAHAFFGRGSRRVSPKRVGGFTPRFPDSFKFAFILGIFRSSSVQETHVLLTASTRLLEERPRPREDERCQEAEAALGEEREETEFPMNFPTYLSSFIQINVALTT